MSAGCFDETLAPSHQFVFVATTLLQYTAYLRLPDKLSNKEKLDRCEEVAESLDLTSCLDTSEFTLG